MFMGHPIYIQDKMDIFSESKSYDSYSKEIKKRKQQANVKTLMYLVLMRFGLLTFLEYFSEPNFNKD